MNDKDYQKLTEAYEKLHDERADLYPLALEEIFATRRRETDMVSSKETGFAGKINLLLRMSRGNDYLLKLYLAFKKKDMEYLNDVLYENAQMEQLSVVSNPGTDHTYFSYNVMPGLLAANMPERIKLILPEENDQAQSSVSGSVVVNLFMGIWYQNADLLDAGLEQAEKKLGQKITVFEKAFISCLKDIALKDTAALETDLDELCQAHTKRKDFGMDTFKKGFCIEAHAIWNLLHWAYDGELEDKIKMPEQKNFCQDLALWQKEHGYNHGKTVTQYPEDIDVFNKLLCCEPPKMCLVTKGKERFLDVDKYSEDIADNLQKMGVTLTVKKKSLFGRLFTKNKS